MDFNNVGNIKRRGVDEAIFLVLWSDKRIT